MGVRCRAFAVGSVVVGENGIGAVRLDETGLNTRRRNRPRFARLMACHTAASVRPNVLKKRVVEVEPSASVETTQLSRRAVRRWIVCWRRSSHRARPQDP